MRMHICSVVSLSEQWDLKRVCVCKKQHAERHDSVNMTNLLIKNQYSVSKISTNSQDARFGPL